MLILKAILIPMLIKTLLATRKPLLCALLYGAALFTNGFLLDMAVGADPVKVFGELALSTGASFGFFWLLRELEDAGPAYWGVLVVGTGILLGI